MTPQPQLTNAQARAARARNWARYVEHLAPIVLRHRSGDTLHVGPTTRRRRRGGAPVICPHCGHRVGSPGCREPHVPIPGWFVPTTEIHKRNNEALRLAVEKHEGKHTTNHQ
ncbi:MAG: hypothetical protein WC718_00420 [Phycisphaerales bacterium]|jgi:hypothetical protein